MSYKNYIQWSIQWWKPQVIISFCLEVTLIFVKSMISQFCLNEVFQYHFRFDMIDISKIMRMIFIINTGVVKMIIWVILFNHLKFLVQKNMNKAPFLGGGC